MPERASESLMLRVASVGVVSVVRASGRALYGSQHMGGRGSIDTSMSPSVTVHCHP